MLTGLVPLVPLSPLFPSLSPAGAGSGRTTTAKVVGSMLSSFDNTRVRSCKLLTPQRQDVFHAHSMSRTQELLDKLFSDAKGGVVVVDDITAVAAPSDREAGGVSSTGKELIEVRTGGGERVE